MLVCFASSFPKIRLCFLCGLCFRSLGYRSSLVKILSRLWLKYCGLFSHLLRFRLIIFLKSVVCLGYFRVLKNNCVVENIKVTFSCFLSLCGLSRFCGFSVARKFSGCVFLSCCFWCCQTLLVVLLFGVGIRLSFKIRLALSVFLWFWNKVDVVCFAFLFCFKFEFEIRLVWFCVFRLYLKADFACLFGCCFCEGCWVALFKAFVCFVALGEAVCWFAVFIMLR